MTSQLLCLGGSTEPGSVSDQPQAQTQAQLALGFQDGSNFTALNPTSEKDCCFLASPGPPALGLQWVKMGRHTFSMAQGLKCLMWVPGLLLHGCPG